ESAYFSRGPTASLVPRTSTMLQTTAQKSDTKPRPAAEGLATPPGLPSLPRLLAAAFATSVLLWLCYFPVAWGFLGWFALVPLLVLVRTETRTRWLYFAAWWSGLAFFLPAISWMRVADPRMYYTWAALSLYCSLYFPVAIFLLRRLDGKTPMLLVVT